MARLLQRVPRLIFRAFHAESHSTDYEGHGSHGCNRQDRVTSVGILRGLGRAQREEATMRDFRNLSIIVLLAVFPLMGPSGCGGGGKATGSGGGGGGSGAPAVGWTSADIGAVGQAGSTSLAGGSFTITASGGDIWDMADGFRFIYQPLSGDGEISARVVSVTHADDWTKAGVMIRETLAAGSAFAMTIV